MNYNLQYQILNSFEADDAAYRIWQRESLLWWDPGEDDDWFKQVLF